MESERHRKIRERAYEIWAEGGRRHGQDDENWHRAEQDVDAMSKVAGAKPAASRDPAGVEPAPAGAAEPKAAKADRLPSEAKRSGKDKDKEGSTKPAKEPSAKAERAPKTDTKPVAPAKTRKPGR